jgi:CDP-glycerol glycerophosphotransferase (TagB/SpsB family)
VAEYLVLRYDIVFYCMPRAIFDEVFFFAQKMIQKRIHAIWCPHGNSDKGAGIFYLEALQKEEAALLYGKQMIDSFKRKGVYDQLLGKVITGNFRHQFFLENLEFYNQAVAKEITAKLPKASKTLLYAPTWQDYEKSTSFFDAIKPLIETLPADHNLIIKLHPNLILQEEFKVEEILGRYEDRLNVLFLTDFPPIYALLSVVDIYIGDMSSLGYDFLLFDKPMFFLNQNARDVENDLGTYLFRCGVTIAPEDYPQIHQVIADYFQYELRNFSEIRKDVYHYAFGHSKPLEQLQTEIHHLYALFSDKELDFF